MAQHDKTAAVACTQWEEDLVLYYYGELGGSERAAVEDHVRGCEPCRFYLKELESILPLTVKPDEPPQAFWDDYSREMRRKLAAGQREKILVAKSSVILSALGNSRLCHGGCGHLGVDPDSRKGILELQGSRRRTMKLFMEILPAAENLEFFKTMEVLDAMDFLEDMGSPVKGSA